MHTRNTKTRGMVNTGTVQFCFIRSGIGRVIFYEEAMIEGWYTMIGVACTVFFGEGHNNDRIHK